MRRIAILSFIVAIVTILYSYSVKAGRCTRVIQQQNSEFILNACNVCQKVNIRRKRRGIAMPVMRTYNVQPRSKFPTSFKGTGRSRITSEVPCEGAAGAGVNIAAPKPSPHASNKCVTMRVIKKKDVALINNCSSCRGVAVQRYNNAGRPLGRQIYRMQPLSVISIKSKGASQVRYIADIPCPP